MGKLRAIAGNTLSSLQSEHLVGRGSQCALRLSPAYVSTQHALVRWNGHAWELVDRGSRNGTYLNGVLIEPGKALRLEPGAIVAFGRLTESWELVDASPPQVRILALDRDVELIGADNVIGVPSDHDPQCTVYRGADGLWKLERPDAPVTNIEDGHVFDAAGQRWRFCSPRSAGPTATAEHTNEDCFSVLCFAVSRDEEFVEVSLERRSGTIGLGSRAHNYLLLLLARARKADQVADLPETSCGWVYKEDLAESLRMTPQQIDGEVFRIRKHFGQHGLDEASTIIERRPRTKQLRLGPSRIRIVRM